MNRVIVLMISSCCQSLADSEMVQWLAGYTVQSGARVNISDSSCVERIVTVRGSRHQLICALSMICRRIEQVRQLHARLASLSHALTDAAIRPHRMHAVQICSLLLQI